MTTRKGFDILHWVFPAMLALAALGVLLSGRDLNEAYLLLEKEVEGAIDTARGPVLAWTQRVVSVLLIAASLERIASHFMQRRPVPSAALTWAFLFFWLATVALPAAFGAKPMISHEFAYSLLLGLAVSLSGPKEMARILDAARTGLFIYMLAGVALVPVAPSLVLDSSYTQGLLPGVPRFGGVATHPVMLGLLTQTALLLLWARPFERRWLNVGAWTLGLAVLFFAQSKTAWIAFFISALCMFFVRRTPDSVQRMGDPRNSSFGVLLCFGIIVLVLAALAAFAMDVPGMIDDYFNTAEGAQLASLTGRDRIWVVAMEEWANHPVFGYGPTIWDADYRQAIAMPNATHAHNQMIDTLARCGTLGGFALVVYAVVLMVMSFRYARATRGLSLAMFATLAMLSISEVPLLLSGYGTDLFTHLLLVATLAGAAAARKPRQAVRVQPITPTPFRTVA